jgi:hypothetical protein
LAYRILCTLHPSEQIFFFFSLSSPAARDSGLSLLFWAKRGWMGGTVYSLDTFFLGHLDGVERFQSIYEKRSGFFFSFRIPNLYICFITFTWSWMLCMKKMMLPLSDLGKLATCELCPVTPCFDAGKKSTWYVCLFSLFRLFFPIGYMTHYCAPLIFFTVPLCGMVSFTPVFSPSHRIV